MNLNHWKQKSCPKYDCRKESCKCGLKKVIIPTALGDDSKDSSVAPKNGAYCNALVVYEANGHIYIYSTEGIPTLLDPEGEAPTDVYTKEEINALLQQKQNLLTFDTVPTLDSTNPVTSGGIKNYVDTHMTTYQPYPASVNTSGTTQEFMNSVLALDAPVGTAFLGTVSLSDLPGSLVQEEVETYVYNSYTIWCFLRSADTAPYMWWCCSYNYQGWKPMDTTYTAGTNVSISSGNVISATDTTYSAFTGTDGNTAGTSGLVPAPATTDAGKFLKADGTWDTAGGGGGDTVYSDKTTSNSSTGGAVYIGNLDSSQVEKSDPTTTDNHYKYFWALPGGNTATPVDSSVNILGDRSSQYGIVIGMGASSNPSAYYGVSIGASASTDNSNANNAVAIGNAAMVYSSNGIAIGRGSKVTNTSYENSVALGSFSQVGRKGEVNIGTGGNNMGYSNTDYRVIGGVHDGQDLHDAATVAQGNTLATAAPDTSTVGVLGQLWTDTTNMHTYQCTAISGSTYTWTQRW